MTNSEATSEAELVHLGTSEFGEAKRLQTLLAERGVELKLTRDPAHCASGKCKVTVEVFVRPQDLPLLKEFLQTEQQRAFEGLEVDPALLDEVYDPEKGTARCPACGTQFSTSARECPDCGLVFAVE